MKVTSFNKEFFAHLVDCLKNNTVQYCVIGDYENLPELVGHDLDMWTSDIKRFRRCLFNTIQECNFKVLIDNRTANGCNVAFYRRDGEEITLMKIDVMKDTSYKSFLTLVDKLLMARNAIPYKNFYVANPSSEALMHFLYPMFEWGKIKKDSYKESIIRECHSAIFFATLKKLWGKSKATDVLNLVKNGDWDAISKQMPYLKKLAFLRFLINPKNWIEIVRMSYYAIARFFKPSGKCLAFCGLDGAGKTTILDELNSMFVDLLKSKKVFYGYWRPFVLPEIRELFGKKNSKSGIDKECLKGRSVDEPEKKPKNPVVSLIKLSYYFVDYCLASLKYGKIRNRGGMALFDRHYIDMVVHPQRFEMKLPRWIILFLYHFIPKADYTFFLWCTPDEIYQRKQEFSKEDILRQTEEYRKVGCSIKNFIPIHTNRSIAEEVDEILSHVALK